MMKINKHIEIVRSSTASLSSMSQRSCDGVFAVLSKHYAKVEISIVNNLSDLESLVSRRPDLVFSGMEAVPQDHRLGSTDSQVWIATYLALNGIACTGSGQMAHELTRDKSLAKQCVLDAGLETSAFCVIKQNQSPLVDDLPLSFPLFIKPTSRGGGVGIDSDSVAHTFEQLQAKTSSIASRLCSDSLVEEYLPGLEFSVAILKDGHSEDFLVMPIELIAPSDTRGARILSGKIKSLDAERAVRVIDEVIKSKVSSLAMDVFTVLGARDYGRIDIRLDRYGTPQFLEANLIPSLISGYGSFPKACKLNINLDYEAMIMRIVKLGLARALDNIDGALELNTVDSPISPLFKTAFEPV